MSECSSECLPVFRVLDCETVFIRHSQDPYPNLNPRVLLVPYLSLTSTIRVVENTSRSNLYNYTPQPYISYNADVSSTDRDRI